jgi:hypothetical protein
MPASTTDLPAWDRLPDEPSRWFARFEHFRLAGPARRWFFSRAPVFPGRLWAERAAPLDRRGPRREEPFPVHFPEVSFTLVPGSSRDQKCARRFLPSLRPRFQV